MEEKRGVTERKMWRFSSDTKRGQAFWKRSRDEVKHNRRLRNYAERNDCRLSRYGDFRSGTEGEGVILFVPYLVHLLLIVRVVSTHMPFSELL